MCSACDDEEIAPKVPVDRDLMRRAREIEAAMPGEPVPKKAWEIYSNLAGGAIEWKHFQRIRLSYDEAYQKAARPPRLGKRGAPEMRVPVCAEITS
jgi:hypothetical protein